MSLVNAVIREANITNTESILQAHNELLPKIIDLTERLKVFSWGLQNYYIDIYLTSDSSRSLEQMNYKNRKYRANSDIEELQEEIQAFRNTFGDNNEQINMARKNFKIAIDSFNDACTMVDGTYILQSAVQDMKSLNYIDAVIKLSNLRSRLEMLTYQGNLALALRSFRAISDSQLAVAQGQLSIEFSKLFKWYYRKSNRTLKYSLLVQQNDPILLERVLKALSEGKQMTRDIQPFSDYFVSQVVSDIIQNNCEIFTEEHIGALVFNVKIDLTKTDCPSIPTIFTNLTAVFEFLETTIGARCKGEKTFFECLGDCNRDEFFRKIIQNCIYNNLPYCEDSHRAYKEIALELDTFNKFLVGLKYVKADKSPLRKYIENTESLLYDTKCRKMLAEVRELIKIPITQETLTAGAVPDPSDQSIIDVTSNKISYDLSTPLFFPKCVISQNVKDIAEIITQHLEETGKYPIEYADQLVLHIKNVTTMYIGLAIQKNGIRLKAHALEIALFFNNCHYLAHILVGPPWKTVLPKPIAEKLNTSLMSYIYDLRIVGMEKLSLYLKRSREAIAIQIAGVLRHWGPEAFEAFNRDVNKALENVKEIKKTWCDILPIRMYDRVMCTLIETVCDAMLRRCFRDVKLISEDLVSLLASRFQYTIDEVQDFYPAIESMRGKIKHWEKFALIPKLFTAQLLEIATMWNENGVLKGKFNCEDVRMIIKMRFPNDDYRLGVLMEIQ